jgi:hypothetical protein
MYTFLVGNAHGTLVVEARKLGYTDWKIAFQCKPEALNDVMEIICEASDYIQNRGITTEPLEALFTDDAALKELWIAIKRYMEANP